MVSLTVVFCVLVLIAVINVDYSGFLYIKRQRYWGSLYGIVVHQ